MTTHLLTVNPGEVEASVKVESSVKLEDSSVNTRVWKLRENKVDKTNFFSGRETWKDKDELLGYVLRQANRAGFMIIIKRSCAIRNPILELVCERSGSWIYGRGRNAWKLAILNGVHNHAMVPYLARHLLEGRLMEDDKKIIHDLINSLVKPKNILKKLMKKRKESMTNIKDTTLLNAVANVLPDSSAIVCYFHVRENIRAKIITDCKVKQKVVVVDEQKKLVYDVKHINLHNQKNLLNLKEKVLTLAFLHVRRFQRQLRFRFQSLSWFQEFMIHQILYMPKFMRPYIKKIVDVIGDGNCGFRAIAESMGLTEESNVMVRRALIQEVKEHRNDYIEIYVSDCRYNYILNGLHPPKNGSSFAPPDKWLRLSDIGHIVGSCYTRPVVELTTLDIGIS
ncbi:hypothetical protein MTR_5g060540 [Medicago truncatula]|uniref:OTU domain-containing protein n=1 Tax=Medicago truncatula TaxID=3880 RepID=G7K9X6_MEDTR|nr:hypothetical protein MTR_5g060540 [Medicago truncatula]